MSKTYHKPVLLQEAIDFLAIHDNGLYVDATLGGGGHTQAILDANPTNRVISFDQDKEAIEHTLNLQKRYAGRLTIVHENFSNLWTQLSLLRIKKIDGILFDLGISSHQIDFAKRGFSFMVEGDLDMRMNSNQYTTAYEVINTFSEQRLNEIFWNFGEERESRKIAQAIVREREKRPIKTTLQLSEIIDFATYSHQKMKAKARIFQSLRIFINSELDVLKTALKDAVRVLNPNGRMVVISYHSLEDRIVKRFFREEEKKCSCPESFFVCLCSGQSTIKVITKKPVIPTMEEMSQNPRARSAKMRVAEKKGVNHE
jgi:16S rRNA (cytosine1402-N4)-methyltransferase